MSKKMDALVLRKREIFFNNLILLGLDKISLEKKHGISFHKDMFAVPNKKGFEVVTYFLFSKLSSVTGKDYNMPWPLVCREHDRIFQKTCCSNLMIFSKENCVKFPRFVPSLISTFGGDRFYNIYLAFSSYVLYKRIVKNGNDTLLSVPSVSRENINTAREILQLSTILKMKKFRDTEMVSCSCYNIFLKFAKILEESLGKLKSLLKSSQELKKKSRSIILSLYPSLSGGSLKMANILEKSFEHLKSVLKRRKVLDDFLSSEEIYWQHLSSEIGETAESEFLNGHDYSMVVTDVLPEDYVKELKDIGCLTSTANGKLSVERFIKIFMVYLTFIVELLQKANLQDSNKTSFVGDIPSIEDELQCIQTLNKKLSNEIIPQLEKDIEKLKIVNRYDDVEENLELSGDLFCSLSVLSFDREAITQRTLHFDANLEKMLYSSSKNQTDSGIKHGLVSHTEKNPLQKSFMTSTYQNLASISSPLVTNCILSEEISVESTKLTETHLMNHSETKDVLTTDPVSSSKCFSPSIEDLEISYSTHFKMRKSWLEEESLSAMTLPDMSFDE